MLEENAVAGPRRAEVLMLSEGSAELPAARLFPAVAERRSASQRVRTVLFGDSDIDGYAASKVRHLAHSRPPELSNIRGLSDGKQVN